jgi:DNA-binding NarL/FixJ family response regulator
MKSICIVDDQGIVLEALKSILSEMPDMLVIGTFTTAEDFINQYPDLKPDLTIMDIDLPGISGIEAMLVTKVVYPNAKFLMLTNYDDDARLFSALKSGADGYLLKKDSFEHIAEAIDSVYDGGAPMTSEIAKKVIHYFHRSTPFDKFYQLTDKEKKVLQYLVDGLLYKEIANEMSVTIDAIKRHTKNIYEKLQVRTRSEAIKKFLTS